jgi:hypothetical protein
MGQISPIYLSKTSNHDAINKCDTYGGTWPQKMCPYISKNWSKAFAKSIGAKQFRKSSYTKDEGSLYERHGECVKIKINAF